LDARVDSPSLSAHFCFDLIGRVEVDSFDSRLLPFVSHVALPASFVCSVSVHETACSLLGTLLETVTVCDEKVKENQNVFVSFYIHSDGNFKSFDSYVDVVSHVIPKSHKAELKHKLGGA
jgi:hypothetical protein